MPDSPLTYIRSASKLLRVHYELALFPLGIALVALLINVFSDENLRIVSLLATLVLLSIMPAIYGRINEIVSRKRFISWKHLFNKFFYQYIGLVTVIVLIMCIPFYLLSLLIISLKAVHLSKFVLVFIVLVFQLIGLYAVPLLFYGNTIKQSLSLGLKCLLGNMNFNLPLVLFLICLSVFSLLHPKSDLELVNTIYHYIRWSFLFVANLILFITVTLILKDKLYCPIQS